MSTPLRLLGFIAALAVAFGVTFVVGRAIGPIEDATATPSHDDAHAGDGDRDGEGGHGDSHAEPTAADQEVPGGLQVSEDGYTLVLDRTETRPGADRPLSFTITGPDGAPVTRYDVAHGKRLHLIAVRRDGTGFQHVHPTLDERTGAWTTELDLTPGSWRTFADFTATGGEPLTLGADLAVPGDFDPAEETASVSTATVGDYEVTLAGDLTPGSDAELTATVTRDGVPVTDLQPYLGAYGHLVALRSGDLAYLHVHPDGEPGDGSTEPGPEVTFYASVPSEGRYHLYLDFRHDGQVRTAAFTLDTSPESSAGDQSGEHTDDHDH
ncbi:hypothetical protein FXB39_02195 [Nocardioides sp. BGMRC 2183]|nr:hypothetical protein FXB39_02195 [Nocardioides sp. BGMRC 2183]